MTNKSLSQQLCEACGIEPIKLYGCEFKNLSEYGITWGVDVCPAAEDESIKCEQCEHSKVAGFLYPDFENNSNNKIKLLEIISKNANRSVYLQDMFPIEYAIIYCLIVLKSKWHAKTESKKLKRAIKNEQWEV